MGRVADELAKWHRLIEDLEDVRSRWKSTPAGPERKRLKAEMRRLRGESDLALDAVSAAIAAEHLSDDPEDRATQLVDEMGHNSSKSSHRRKDPLH